MNENEGAMIMRAGGGVVGATSIKIWLKAIKISFSSIKGDH